MKKNSLITELRLWLFGVLLNWAFIIVPKDSADAASFAAWLAVYLSRSIEEARAVIQSHSKHFAPRADLVPPQRTRVLPGKTHFIHTDVAGQRMFVKEHTATGVVLSANPEHALEHELQHAVAADKLNQNGLKYFVEHRPPSLPPHASPKNNTQPN